MTDNQRIAVREIIGERSYWYLCWLRADQRIRKMLAAVRESAVANEEVHRQAELRELRLAAEVRKLRSVQAAAVELLKEIDQTRSRTDTRMDPGCERRIESSMVSLRAALAAAEARTRNEGGE